MEPSKTISTLSAHKLNLENTTSHMEQTNLHDPPPLDYLSEKKVTKSLGNEPEKLKKLTQQPQNLIEEKEKTTVNSPSNDSSAISDHVFKRKYQFLKLEYEKLSKQYLLVKKDNKDLHIKVEECGVKYEELLLLHENMTAENLHLKKLIDDNNYTSMLFLNKNKNNLFKIIDIQNIKPVI